MNREDAEMKENDNYKSFLCEESESQSSQVRYTRTDRKNMLPFSKILNLVKNQIELGCFEITEIEMANEIAMIIAETYKLPGNATVRIAGNNLPAEMVSEVYEKLEHEHILHVIENYEKVTYEIKHTKTYLRTALYNSVFELNGKNRNKILTDMPWLAEK